jgi:hypothetical protein
MGNESNGGARMEEIGAMIVHAEAAQAALDKGLAAHAENVVNITRLIQYGGGVLKKLQAEAEQLGPRAEQAGAGAVREEVRESLAGAGAVVGDAARAALRPVMADVVAGIGQAHRAGMSLDEKAELFSNRVLAIMAAVAIGALIVVVFGVWVALAWQRSEIASLVQEKADLRGEISAMEATARRMQADGLKIEFQQCADENGRNHLCVAGKPGQKRPWGTEQAPFYILKGY